MTHDELVTLVQSYARSQGLEVQVKQSNHEGDLIDYLHQAGNDSRAVIINPAAYTHTSIALLDAVRSISIPVVEVHLTDIESREPFRRVSYIKDAVVARFFGKGIQSYYDAVDYLKEDHR
jgi:3-dehydroquinate dehydratase-2